MSDFQISDVGLLSTEYGFLNLKTLFQKVPLIAKMLLSNTLIRLLLMNEYRDL